MQKDVKVTVVVEKTGTGFSAYAKEIDGLATVGDSITELKQNFNEVLYYHVEYMNETEDAGLSVKDFQVEYVIDLQQFFEYFSVINKSAFAEHYLKINPSLFRQYTKGLASLSDDKLKQISKGLHSLANDINELTLA